MSRGHPISMYVDEIDKPGEVENTLHYPCLASGIDGEDAARRC